MPSITTWQRLEPRTRSSILGAVRARIHDPAWMLGRQRQLGEWTAEDRGSAVRADLALRTSRLTRYRPWSATTALVLGDGIPLEAVVEAETAPPPAASGAYFAARAGQAFLRSLGTDLGRRYGPAYVAYLPLQLPDADILERLDVASRATLDVLAGRVPDGEALYAEFAAALRPDLGTPTLPAEPPVDPGDADAVADAAGTWLTWFDTLRSPPRAEAWDPHRLEHRFQVAAAAPTSNGTGSGEVTLTAPGFGGGHLDWTDLDVVAGISLGAAGSMEQQDAAAVPTPIRYPGMPNPRWWEFEDGAVDLGSVDVAPEDLGRLMLLEFALVYGNDFLHIPVDLPVGSLCWVDRLTVTNTFGETTEIPSAEQNDGPTGPWSMFRLSRSGGGRGDFLLLAPASRSSLHGPALEEVVLMRDEMANLAWAVEQRVQTPAGTTAVPQEIDADRRHRTREDDRVPSADDTDPNERAVAYRLATEVPDHWHPLRPVLISRALAGVNWNDVELEVSGLHPVRGRLLRPDGATPRRIAEAEVPRSGAVVTRTWQRARGVDGRVHQWIERRRVTGHGEGSSGLAFDTVVPGTAATDG